MRDWSRCLKVGMLYNKVTMLPMYSNFFNAESVYLYPYSATWGRGCMVSLHVQVLAAYLIEELHAIRNMKTKSLSTVAISYSAFHPSFS